jgi:hypothetical protein
MSTTYLRFWLQAVRARLRRDAVVISESTVGTAQVLARRDAIPDNLLKLLDLGKPSLFSSRPDGIIADTNFGSSSGKSGNVALMLDAILFT